MMQFRIKNVSITVLIIVLLFLGSSVLISRASETTYDETLNLELDPAEGAVQTTVLDSVPTTSMVSTTVPVTTVTPVITTITTQTPITTTITNKAPPSTTTSTTSIPVTTAVTSMATVTTVVTTQVPVTTTTTIPHSYDGWLATKGRIGVYQPDGRPIETATWSYLNEGREVSYFEEYMENVEVYGSSGLQASTFVVYISTEVEKPDGSFVKLRELQFYKGHFTMKGYGFDATEKIQTAKGNKDLSTHWWGRLKNPPRNKISIADLYTQVGIPRGRYTFHFVHQIKFECLSTGNQLFFDHSQHELDVQIYWETGGGAKAKSVLAVGGVTGGKWLPVWFVLAVIVYFLLTKGGKT